MRPVMTPAEYGLGSVDGTDMSVKDDNVRLAVRTINTTDRRYRGGPEACSRWPTIRGSQINATVGQQAGVAGATHYK
jgi:hypothetical protein